MKVCCIKSFIIQKFDNDGFEEKKNMTVEKGTIWNVQQEEKYKIIGGEVRLENDNLEWLEISKEWFNAHFKEEK